MNDSILNYLIAILSFFLVSCGGSKGAMNEFDSLTASHQRIAILPVNTTLKLSNNDAKKISKQDLDNLQMDQSFEVQDAIESYLVTQKMRVRVQSKSVTNSKLKQNSIDLAKINDYDVTQLCSILGVDAVVTGELESTQLMNDELAQGLNIAKGIADNAGGLFSSLARGVNTNTNEGWCSLSLFEKSYGDRLWSYKDELELGAGSNTKNIMDKLMKSAVKDFPYRK